MIEENPIIFFRELKKPGVVSVFAILKDVKDLVAKNKKPYLRLVLVDPFSQEFLIQIWGNNELYAPANMFMRRNLLIFNGPIHLIKLNFDGEFISSTNESTIDTMPTQHPIYQKYLLLNEYRIFRNIPNKPEILNEIRKLLDIKPLIDSILFKFEEYGVIPSDDLIVEVTKLVTDKTYTGTIYLIHGNPQLTITEQYTNYLLKQFNTLLNAFKNNLINDKTVPIILLRRLQKDLISLYEYTSLHQ